MPKRTAVIGAGSVGIVLAAAAYERGHDVVLCARRRPARATVSLERGDGIRRRPRSAGPRARA